MDINQFRHYHWNSKSIISMKRNAIYGKWVLICSRIVVDLMDMLNSDVISHGGKFILIFYIDNFLSKKRKTLWCFYRVSPDHSEMIQTFLLTILNFPVLFAYWKYSRVVPDIRLAGYPAFFYIRYPAGYPVSVAGYPAGYPARNTI